MILKYLNLIDILIATALIVSCSSSTHVLVGKKRIQIDPSQVKIYSKPPTKYEDIAFINASSKNSWAFTEQGKMNKVIELLKKEEASLGANGIIIKGLGEQSDFKLSNVYGNDNIAKYEKENYKTGQGMAIFVVKE